MGKKDFDIEFDFDEEYGFDPKSFLGTDDYDDNVDLNAFSDDELGLTSQAEDGEAEDAAAEDAFDPDDDLDLDAFLNMGSQEEEAEDEEEDWSDEDEDSEYEEEESEDSDEYEETLPEEEESEEADMDETMEYTEEEELLEDSEEETYEFEDEQEDPEEPPRKTRQKKERKPIQLPKIQLPKLKTPNIFTKFYDLYFAPVLTKNWQNPEDVQDPNAPRRRRRKSRQQIFKEVYLPPILVCVTLILVLSFVIGTLSNVIEEHKIAKQQEQSRLDASQSAAEQAEQLSQQLAQEAAVLAAGYDYDAAIAKLESIGDLNQYPELSSLRGEYVTAKQSLVEYKDPTMIPNLSFHVLVHDMARAKKDTELGGKYNRNFVTTNEFSKILQQLYDNGYVLVDFDSFVGSAMDVNSNEQFQAVSMWLPADKKPVMITETMVNYFNYMIDSNEDGLADAQGDGFASRLVVDGAGNIKAEYVDENGQTLVGNYDLVPILEDFIAQHPDFSYKGARAILAVTGSEGVFGYRCNTSYISNKSQDYYDQEVAGAKQIVQALQAKGYTIACYTYKNDNYANANANTISADLTKWASEITTIIGPVKVFVFAQQGNLTDYTGSSFDVMYKAGFRYYIANATGTSNATTTINQTYVRQNRLMVTGNSMAWNPSWFTGMFNCSAVLDSAVRGDVPN